MKKNPSGLFFLSHLENRLFNRNLLRFDHEIDRNCLKKAWRRTLEECPFFEQGLLEENGELMFVPRKSTCRVEPLPAGEGEDEAAPHTDDLAFVRTSSDRMMIGVSHALTDEFGKKVFTTLLLYHYFCLMDRKDYPHPYADEAGEKTVFDTESELMEDILFPETWEGENGFKSAFILPEHLNEEKEAAVFRVRVLAKDFYTAVRRAFPLDDEEFQRVNDLSLPIGRLQCVFVYLLLGRVIERLNPGHLSPITMRCPVNTRSLCGKDFALRNFSLPQAVLSLDPEVFSKGFAAQDGNILTEQLERQLSKDMIGWQLKALRKRLRTGIPDPAVASRYHQTMIVTNVGKEYYEPTKGRVLEDHRFAAGGYPLAVYLNRVGDFQEITISQSFDSQAYYKGFLKELQGEGL